MAENINMAKHGGKRNGAGRKKLKDPKVQLTIYPRKSQIKAVGGKEKAKELAVSVFPILKES